MENVTMNGTQQAVAMAKAAGLKATFVDTRLACVGARIHQVRASKRTPGTIFVRKSSFAKTGSRQAEAHFQRKGASTRPPTPSTAAMAALGTPVSKATAGFMKLVRNGLFAYVWKTIALATTGSGQTEGKLTPKQLSRSLASHC